MGLLRVSNKNLTLAYIRDQLRQNHLETDPVKTARYLLDEYDLLMSEYRKLKKPTEYMVVTPDD